MTKTDGSDAANAGAPPQSSVTEFDDGAVFTLHRPSKLNAITGRILHDLEQCLDALLARDARLLVIAGGSDRAFCAGTDVAELRGLSHDAQVEKCIKARNLLVRLSQSPIVSVAAIGGVAYGGGLELAMACTLRIASPSATFSLPEIKLGLVPAYAGTQMLPALVGPARALEIMLTGRILSVEEALSIGLIHRVSQDEGPIDEAALRFGREVTCHSAEAAHAIRKCVDAFGGGLSASGLRAEEECVRAIFDSPDAREGLAAFFEKRAPNFGKNRSSS